MITFRRRYLDRCLESHVGNMRGNVLDIGGKKASKRGRFRPPASGITSWKYVNPDPATQPDYLCGAESIPLPDASMDTILMTEVLEYLPDPFRALSEAARLLKPGGRAFISVPFLMPVHNDHESDRMRFTGHGLRSLMEASGLRVESLEPMGGLGAVLHDLLHVRLGYAARRGGWASRIGGKLLRYSVPLFRFAERKGEGGFHINTGYFAVGSARAREKG